MNVQGYMQRSEETSTLCYADVNHLSSAEQRTQTPPPGLSSSTAPSSVPKPDPELLNPAVALARKDKRKSSPAVLGLLGLSDEAEAQLSYHLSQHRNSIEAAMLLANFNRLPADKGESDNQSQDDMSVSSPSLPNLSSERRYSYDANMSWKSMPPSFVERSTFLQDLASSQQTTTPEQEKSKLSWSQNQTAQDHPLGAFHPMAQAPPSHPNDMMYQQHQPQQQRQEPSAYHPLAPVSRFPQPPPPTHPMPMVHPLAPHPSPHPDAGLKREHPIDHPQYYPYAFVNGPPPPSMHPHAHPYYYPNKLPLPSADSPAMHAQLAAMKSKRRKNKEDGEDEEVGGVVEPGDADFPDMSYQDMEAARFDPEARPRRQKLRYPGDMYTPQWVRYNGQSKEGLCDTCQPGRWLQLKNSAFWYHKQFFHGISSVSGKEFMQPLETRWVDQDLVEGLCHQCRQWVSVSNVKRKNSVLWYRHAHKCHVYHKPKAATPRRR
ncbi:hypothetical protein EC973_006653 [Apophysomyces ossiformis]|uniref:Transcription regulator Rua1 C-terminal domain-containing protein n=1 Tax=Apophysomyces ossiformis TaxID=679940 RepID=A0A8H7BNA1_9FUNG|nr:hypothetical protein EC973_006653 [Apophysomyces ossiformis]